MIVTVQEVKDFHEISWTDKDFSVEVISQCVDEEIKKYIGFNPEKWTQEEFYDGSGEFIFYLNRAFIDTSAPFEFQFNNGTQATPDYEDFDVEDYAIYHDVAKIKFYNMVMPRGQQNIRVSYTAGRNPDITVAPAMPAKLRLAFMQMFWEAWNVKDSQGIRSESVNGSSVTYASASEIVQNSLMWSLSLLDNYKRFYV